MVDLYTGSGLRMVEIMNYAIAIAFAHQNTISGPVV